MARKPRDQSRDQEIIDTYLRLHSGPRVAELFGISDETVFRILGLNGVSALTRTERRKIRVSDETIVQLYSELKNANAVAKKLEISEKTVSRVLWDVGINSRAIKADNQRFFHGEELAKLLADYSSGKSANQLAKENGCSPWAVVHAVANSGISLRRKPRMNDSEILKAKELYESGMTFKKTAEALGRSDQGIIRILSRRYPEIIRSDTVGPGSPHWQNGRTVDGHGYVWVWVSDDDPFKCMASKNGRGGETRYVLEHRLNMARKLGRPLLTTETVHHIDGNRANNDPANLELRQGRHGKHVVMCCTSCGSRNIGHTTIGGSVSQ